MTQADEETLAAAVERLKLTVDSEFVPFSRSRNAKETSRSLNWRVTLKRDGKDVLTTDYSAGVAHAPAYKRVKSPFRMTVDENRLIEAETEHGRECRLMLGGVGISTSGKPIKPDPLDVIHSLALDSDVLDFPTFEQWASEFGYDEDSRKAEKIYHACLTIGLQMRAALGDAALQELQAAARNH